MIMTGVDGRTLNCVLTVEVKIVRFALKALTTKVGKKMSDDDDDVVVVSQY